jgi:hypothetical protein
MSITDLPGTTAALELQSPGRFVISALRDFMPVRMASLAWLPIGAFLLDERCVFGQRDFSFTKYIS